MSHRNFTRLCLEQLEDRLTPAGNVMAALSGQDLLVSGDNLNNEISLTQNSVGDVTITGLAGTTVNGLSVVTFLNPNLIKAEIRMGDGADRVTISGIPGLSIANDLNVELGAGNDTLNASAVQTGANFVVKGEQGADVVRLSALMVQTDLMVEMGQDSGAVSIYSSTVGGNLGIITDLTNDAISLHALSVGAAVSVETKDGNDSVSLSNVSARSLSVITDLGADTVSATNVTTLEDTIVETGGDNDSVGLTVANVGRSVKVDAGAGTDAVAATNVAAAVDAIFIGGAGVDTFDNDGITAGSILEIKEFETTGELSGNAANAAFVQALYVKFLKRVGNLANANDAGGWVNQLNSGTPASTVANGIVRSAEALGFVVDGLYRSILGREADAGGRSFHINLIANGMTIERIQSAFFASAEYRLRFAGDAAYVTSLYQSLLGRTPTQSDINSWLNLLPSLGAQGVAAGFLNSTEFRNREVTKLYFDVLERTTAPSAAEVASNVNTGLDLLSLRVAFAGSAEFFRNG